MVDPIGAVLALLVYQGVVAGSVGDALPTILLSLLKTLRNQALLAIKTHG